MSAPRWRRGRLLVAATHLDDDPNFRRAVVLVLEHADEGALGIVLNKPMEVPAAEALPEGLSAVIAEGSPIFRGGPVQPGTVIVMADFEDTTQAGGITFDSVGIVDPEVVESGRTPALRRARAFAGYAGWGGGQLEGEIRDDAWIDVTPDAGDVFAEDPSGLWRAVLLRAGGSYRLMATAPDDPLRN
jgi:putative transcriptional regulator